MERFPSHRKFHKNHLHTGVRNSGPMICLRTKPIMHKYRYEILLCNWNVLTVRIIFKTIESDEIQFYSNALNIT